MRLTKAQKRARQESAFPAADPAVIPTIASAAEIGKDAAAKKDAKKAADEIPVIFTPDQVVWLFDAYVILLSFVFALILKAEYKPIHEELQFDENEKQAMAKPLARIASKYAPVAWAGMTAEIELVGLLGVWTLTGFKRAQAVAEKEKAKKKGPQSEPREIPRGEKAAVLL